ncbi:MAG: hypothetical protein QNJ54_25350 [Prochloraceae cyanobacterium]|nr:hypothetical protein [Prochloraceae cyanobacterium]
MRSFSDYFDFNPDSLEENIKEYLETKDQSKIQNQVDGDTRYSFSLEP